MSSARHWLRAIRLRTLPLALSSIAMGGFLAADHRVFRWSIFLLCCLTTIFLQILSNLANDYGDSIHGADNAERLGPKRAVQSGAISADAMKTAIIITAALSLFSGIALLVVAFGTNWRALLFFLALGLLCIGAALAYTIGRRPYGYAGLGDLSVFIFFGLVGVVGSYYLYAYDLSSEIFLPAACVGLFSVAVLNINNIRDIDSDRSAGKLSLPVRLGKSRALKYHAWLLVLPVILLICYALSDFQSPIQLIFLLAIPLLVVNYRGVSGRNSASMDPMLRQMALTTLIFVVLFGAGLLIA